MTQEDIRTEADAVAEIVREGFQPQEIAANLYALPWAHEPIRDIHSVIAEFPRRKQGVVKLADPASWCQYINRHGDANTEVFVEKPGAGHVKAVGVLNSHAEFEAGWCDHKAELLLEATPEWMEWTKYSGQWLSQDQFADLIDDNASDIVKPEAATLLEVAQTIRATNNVVWVQSKRLNTGERQIEYREDMDAKAGKAGDITIPDEIRLGIRVFPRRQAYMVTAKFRFRLVEGVLGVQYRIVRPENIWDQAVDDLLASLDVPYPIFR